MKILLKYAMLLALILMVSCGGKKSEPKPDILTEKQMVDLLVDMHLTDAILFLEGSPSNDKRDKVLLYYPSLLEKHKVTKAQMDSSVTWYINHPDAYVRIYDEVNSKFKKMQDQIASPSSLK